MNQTATSLDSNCFTVAPPDHLLPDGHDGYLFTTGRSVGRVSNQRALVGPVLLPGQGNRADVVLDEISAYALSQFTTFTGQYFRGATLNRFDPVTLTTLTLPTQLDGGPNLRLDMATSGAAVVSGPQVNNVKQVAPGVFGGWPGGAPGLQPLNEDPVAASIWPYVQGNARNANTATNPGLGIFAKGHFVFGYHHVSVKIVPTHQDLWLQRRPNDFNQRDNGKWFATIGTGATDPLAEAC